MSVASLLPPPTVETAIKVPLTSLRSLPLDHWCQESDKETLLDSVHGVYHRELQAVVTGRSRIFRGGSVEADTEWSAPSHASLWPTCLRSPLTLSDTVPEFINNTLRVGQTRTTQAKSLGTSVQAHSKAVTMYQAGVPASLWDAWFVCFLGHAEEIVRVAHGLGKLEDRSKQTTRDNFTQAVGLAGMRKAMRDTSQPGFDHAIAEVLLDSAIDSIWNLSFDVERDFPEIFQQQGPLPLRPRGSGGNAHQISRNDTSDA